MRLTKKEKDRLFNFLGYGSPKARIWFLGMEEGFPKDNLSELYTEIKIRATRFESFMGLAEGTKKFR